MSLERKIQKIENQLNGSLPVLETDKTKWAFDLARARFSNKYDPAERRAIIYLNSILTEPEPEESLIFPDTPHPHYEPDPDRRAVKIQEYASKLIKKFGDEKNYHRIRNENCRVTKYFRGLAEVDQRQQALGEPVC